MISEQPMSPEDFRMKMSELITFNIADLEVTGHGRKRWETNLQNSINDLKSEGLIAHLGKNQYVSPIPNSNPLNPEEFWNDFSRNAQILNDDEPVCEFYDFSEGLGEYFVKDVDRNTVVFSRKPLSEKQKINTIKFDKRRVLAMANAINACGGRRTRVTIAGNREVYSQILVPLSSMLEFGQGQQIVQTDVVFTQPIESFQFVQSRSEKDMRKRVLKPGIQRVGVKKFRDSVLSNYDNKCAITGISTLDSIQAAHIMPYNGPESNHVSNGIAMRSDVHRLFDLGKIRIHPDDLSIHLHPDVAADYESMCAEFLLLPPGAIHPHKDVLEIAWNFDENRWF